MQDNATGRSQGSLGGYDASTRDLDELSCKDAAVASPPHTQLSLVMLLHDCLHLGRRPEMITFFSYIDD